MSSRAYLVALWLAVGAALGCSPTLYSFTPAPPGREAKLESHEEVFTLSEGAAIAVQCVNWKGAPCLELRAATDNPKTAVAYPSHLAELQRWGNQPVSTIVVVGLQSGNTVLRIDSEGRTNEYAINVVPAPYAAPVAAPKK